MKNLTFSTYSYCLEATKTDRFRLFNGNSREQLFLRDRGYRKLYFCKHCLTFGAMKDCPEML